MKSFKIIKFMVIAIGISFSFVGCAPSGDPIKEDSLLESPEAGNEGAVSAGIPNLQYYPDDLESGEINVDLHSGNFQYQYPINVPNGPGGISPNINLNYSSQSNQPSWIGFGWSIDLGSIERVGKEGDIPSFNENDKFVLNLNGNRNTLISIDQENHIYRTETDLFYRVQAYFFPDRNHPRDYWEVTDNSGMIYRFGISSNEASIDHMIVNKRNEPPSQALQNYPIKWSLSEIEDPFGNLIEFTYIKGEDELSELGSGFGHNSIYPGRITYNNNEIIFEYSDLDNSFVKAEGGLITQYTKKLIGINVIAGGNLIRRYELNHNDVSDQTTRNSFLFLEGVKVFGSSNNQNLPEVSFDYEVPETLFQGFIQYTMPPKKWDIRELKNDDYTKWPVFCYEKCGDVYLPFDGETLEFTTALIDMDGDNLIDFVDTGSNGENWEVWLNDGTGFNKKTQWSGSNNFNSIKKITAVRSQNDPAIVRFINVKNMVVDFNGDKLPDYVRGEYTTPTKDTDFNAYDFRIQVFLNTGTGFDPLIEWFFEGLSGDEYLEDITPLRDVNFDGWLDYASPISHTFLNDGSKFIIGIPFEVGCLNESGVDLNGDGLRDCLTLKTDENGVKFWSVRYNNGHSLEEAIDVPGTKGKDFFDQFVEDDDSFITKQSKLIDINGDGLLDYIQFRSHEETALSRNWFVSYNLGHGFSEEVPIGSYSIGTEITFIENDKDSTVLNDTFDINGDLVPDFVSFNRGIVRFGKPEFIQRMTRITHPLGGETTINYKTSTSTTDSSGIPNQIIVDSITTSPNSFWVPDENYKVTYEYAGGRSYNTIEERIFLGFEFVRYFEESSGNFTDYYFTQSRSNNGNVEQKEVFQQTVSGYTRLATEVTNYQEDFTKPYFTPIDERLVLFYGQNDTVESLDQQTSDIFSSPSRIIRQSLVYDEYGNTIKEELHGDINLTGDEKLIVRTFNPNLEKWIISKPATQIEYSGLQPIPNNYLSGTWYSYDGQSKSSSPTKGFISEISSIGLNISEETDESGSIQEELISYPVLSTRRFNYDENGVYIEDGYGRLVSTTDPNGNVHSFTFDSEFPTFIIEEINPTGHITKYGYFGISGESIEGGYWGKRAWELSPGANGDKAKEEFLIKYNYDSFGRLSKITLPYDHSEVIGESGSIWYEYISEEINGLTVFGIRKSQRTSKESFPNSEGYIFFDGLGREIMSRQPGEFNRLFTRVTYNSNGLASTWSPRSSFDTLNEQEISFSYDALGRMTKIVKPNEDSPREIIYEYSGLDIVKIDELGFETFYQGDAYNNVIEIVDAIGNITKYDYDLLGNLRKITDVNGNEIWWKYDDLSRPTEMHHPDAGNWSYVYDSAGNLIQEVSSLGAIVYSYDAINRITGKDLNNDNKFEVEMIYDLPDHNSIGYLSKIINHVAESQISLFYDGRGRLIKEERSLPNLPEDNSTFRTIYSFDSMNRIESLEYPDGFIVNYTYNKQGKIDSIDGFIENVDYDGRGRMTSIQFGNGVVTSINYFQRSGFLDSIKSFSPNGESFIDLDYKYSEIGNLESLINHKTNVQRNYIYDPLGRITEVYEGQFGTDDFENIESFRYDQIGNLIFNYDWEQRFDTGFDESGSYRGGPHAISYIENIGDYFYDKNGNLIEGGGKLFQYSPENYLVRIENQISGTVSEYKYDGQGRKIYQYKNDNNQVTETWYGGNGYIRESIDGSVTETKFIILNGLRIAAKIDNLNGSNVEYYHTDFLGSINVVTNENGEVKSEFTYTTFGITNGEQSSNSARYRFTGQEYDTSIGLYNFNARIYDPNLGRFLSPDPIISDFLNPQSLNPYSYVLNNPLRYLDPTGLFFEDIWKRVSSIEWWTGGLEGGIKGFLYGFNACDVGCGIGGFIIGFGVGAELNYQASKPGAHRGWEVANFIFQVGTSAGLGYTGGSYAFTTRLDEGWLGALGAGTKRALYSEWVTDGIDAIDNSGSLVILVRLGLATEAVFAGYGNVTYRYRQGQALVAELKAEEERLRQAANLGNQSWRDFFKELGYGIGAHIVERHYLGYLVEYTYWEEGWKAYPHLGAAAYEAYDNWKR